jgi:transposase
MKVEEVILRAVSGQITFWQAARILRMSPRHLRRVMQRYRHSGFDGLLDRRKGRPSTKRVPWVVAEQVLRLYREKYFDFSVRHFHEKLREERGIAYSYTCIKLLLQGAGLVMKARKRGPHRRRRERRPMAGMLLHIDASRHQMAGRGTVARSAGGSRQRHQRDLLRATGGGRVHRHGAGRVGRSSAKLRHFLRFIQRSR